MSSRTYVRRVIPELDTEIREIMKKFNVGWNAAQRIWWKEHHNKGINWKEI